MKVLLISGKAQHGKDTTAKIMQKKLQSDGNKVQIAHYADLLKYICKQFFAWDGIKDEQGRHILQYVGTDVIREQSPDYWVDFIIDVAKMFPNEWDYMVIPDCRFPNEVTKLVDEGLDSIHIRVVRDGYESSLTTEQQAHSSETALDDIVPDYYIKNNGALADLERAVEDFLIELNGYHQVTMEEYMAGQNGV